MMRPKAKACGVCTMRRRLRSSVSVTIACVVDFLHGVGDGDAGHRGAVLLAGSDGAGDQGAGQERPRRVMDEDELGRSRAQRFEPGAHRGLPRRAAGDRRQQLFKPGGRSAKKVFIVRDE